MKTKNAAGFVLQVFLYLVLFNIALLFLIARPSAFSPFRYMGY